MPCVGNSKSTARERAYPRGLKGRIKEALKEVKACRRKTWRQAAASRRKFEAANAKRLREEKKRRERQARMEALADAPECPICPPGSNKKLGHRGRHIMSRAASSKPAPSSSSSSEESEEE